MKIGIVGGKNSSYKNFLKKLGKKVEFIDVIDKKDMVPGINLLVFTGGADVSPILYNQKKGKFTSTNMERDERERRIFNIDKKIPKLGICRGSQFLTVMSGGKLIQHVENHTKPHEIAVFKSNGEEKKFTITSTHHQMMYPYDVKNYKLIAWSNYNLSNTYLNGENINEKQHKNFLEPEIVYYSDTNSLCIQGHPEMSNCPEETKNLVVSLIKNYL